MTTYLSPFLPKYTIVIKNKVNEDNGQSKVKILFSSVYSCCFLFFFFWLPVLWFFECFLFK